MIEKEYMKIVQKALIDLGIIRYDPDHSIELPELQKLKDKEDVENGKSNNTGDTGEDL